MLDELLKLQNLGSRNQISTFLKLLSNKSYLEKDLRLVCSDQDYTFSKSFDGVLALLEFLEIVKITDKISLEKKYHNKVIIDEICFLLFKKLSKIKELHNIIKKNSLSFDQSILINNNFIGLKFSSIRNLLIDLNFLEKDKLIENFFVITEKYQNWFYKEGITLIEKSETKKLSLEQFKKKQERQAELGLEAEKFVLFFEITTRKNHPQNSKIKIISNDDVSAGYDILSYLSDSSIILNKYIEVKSYSGNQPYFHWSKNEVKTAKNEKENYFLYLVNRDEIKNPDYSPIMISDPYSQVFESSEWDMECDSYYLEKLE
jgi:hypothetical protein